MDIKIFNSRVKKVDVAYKLLLQKLVLLQNEKLKEIETYEEKEEKILIFGDLLTELMMVSSMLELLYVDVNESVELNGDYSLIPTLTRVRDIVASRQKQVNSYSYNIGVLIKSLLNIKKGE